MRKEKLRLIISGIYSVSAIITFLANMHHFSEISNLILLASWMVILFLLFDLVFDYGRRRFDFGKGQRKYFNSILWSLIVSIALSLLEFRQTSLGLTLLNEYLPWVSHLLNAYAITLYYRSVLKKDI